MLSDLQKYLKNQVESIPSVQGSFVDTFKTKKGVDYSNKVLFRLADTDIENNISLTWERTTYTFQVYVIGVNSEKSIYNNSDLAKKVMDKLNNQFDVKTPNLCIMSMRSNGLKFDGLDENSIMVSSFNLEIKI